MFHQYALFLVPPTRQRASCCSTLIWSASYHPSSGLKLSRFNFNVVKNFSFRPRPSSPLLLLVSMRETISCALSKQHLFAFIHCSHTFLFFSLIQPVADLSSSSSFPPSPSPILYLFFFLLSRSKSRHQSCATKKELICSSSWTI